jgi:hypothetical protein
VRLRRLSEAECYTRCYGGRPGERITVVRVLARDDRGGEKPPRPELGKKAA